MKFTTITIPAIEMTRVEEHELWQSIHRIDRGKWPKKHGIIDWNTDDGNNCIRFVGEDFYREVVEKGN